MVNPFQKVCVDQTRVFRTTQTASQSRPIVFAVVTIRAFLEWWAESLLNARNKTASLDKCCS